jgi:hypothetical protein
MWASAALAPIKKSKLSDNVRLLGGAGGKV